MGSHLELHKAVRKPFHVVKLDFAVARPDLREQFVQVLGELFGSHSARQAGKELAHM